MAKGSSLTAAQLRDASPIDKLPWELIRKGQKQVQGQTHGDFYGSLSDAVAAIRSDMAKLEKRYGHLKGVLDTDEMDRLLGQIGQADTFPGVVSAVVSPYLGVTYEAEIRDRRRPAVAA